MFIYPPNMTLLSIAPKVNIQQSAIQATLQIQTLIFSTSMLFHSYSPQVFHPHVEFLHLNSSKFFKTRSLWRRLSSHLPPRFSVTAQVTCLRSLELLFENTELTTIGPVGEANNVTLVTAGESDATAWLDLFVTLTHVLLQLSRY